jgi:alcohol dehydrogenase, propanol-preferring
VRIGDAGACHSNLHLMNAPPPQRPIRLPFTLGHENAGWVENLGPGAGAFAPGEAVIVYGPWECGNCKNRWMSMENYCENAGSASGTTRTYREGHVMSVHRGQAGITSPP